MSNSTKNTVKKYGYEICYTAFRMNEAGNGARTIGQFFGLHTNTADAIINAGRELTNNGKQ